MFYFLVGMFLGKNERKINLPEIDPEQSEMIVKLLFTTILTLLIISFI